MIFTPKPGIRYYDRGDMTAADLTMANTTQDGHYHEVDLSGIVPVGTTAIVVNATLINPTPGSSLQIRKAGNVNKENVWVLSTQVDGLVVYGTGIVAPSADRKVEYKLTGVDWLWIIINLTGWFA